MTIKEGILIYRPTRPIDIPFEKAVAGSGCLLGMLGANSGVCVMVGNKFKNAILDFAKIKISKEDKFILKECSPILMEANIQWHENEGWICLEFCIGDGDFIKRRFRIEKKEADTWLVLAISGE